MMAKEYLVVLFPRKRRILINDAFLGHTNTKLEIEGGRYEVKLGPPKNFTPDAHDIDLHNTSFLRPMIIVFEEQSDDV